MPSIFILFTTDTEWWLDSKLGRVAYRYERLMGLCFQCGQVGHEATRCIHPYDGATANIPYGDWLRAGTKPRTDGSRGNTDSSPHRSAAQPSLARVTENPPMTSEDVDPITGIFGADKTGPTMDISTPQITEITSTRPNTSKPDPTEMDHTPTHLCQP